MLFECGLDHFNTLFPPMLVGCGFTGLDHFITLLPQMFFGFGFDHFITQIAHFHYSIPPDVV